MHFFWVRNVLANHTHSRVQCARMLLAVDCAKLYNNVCIWCLCLERFLLLFVCLVGFVRHIIVIIIIIIRVQQGVDNADGQ